jgi:anti-anti-sigma regulatory factor
MAPTLGTLDVLARLHLAARRHGCRIRLVRATPELQELIAFAGLEAVLPVETGGEAEEREERVGVEEERELTDPPA